MDVFTAGIGRPFERLSDRIGVNTIPVVRSYQPGIYTFTAEVDGIHVFYLWGGGGRGRGARQADGSQQTCTGGGSGGFVKKTIALMKGDTVPIVVGQGGEVFLQGSSGASIVRDATASRVTLPGGLVLEAGGGGNGSRANAGALAGTGGTATGGDLNVPGSAGGLADEAGGSGANGGAGGAAATSAGGGAGAPGDGVMLGGKGGDASFGTVTGTGSAEAGNSPGAGGGAFQQRSTAASAVAFDSAGGDGLVLVVFQKEAPL